MNPLSGGDIADILLALGVLVPAIGAAAVPIILALRRIEAKAEVIAASVNGAASKQVAKIETLTGTVETLKSVISDQRDTAKALASGAEKLAENKK